MFTSFNLVKNFFITVEYDIKICLFWAVFFPGFFRWVYPKKTHRVFWVRARVSEPCNFGFTDHVLRGMTSFVSGRMQQVSYDGQLYVAHSSSTVWGSAGIRSRPPILRPVHHRLEQSHSQSRSAATPVSGRRTIAKFA